MTATTRALSTRQRESGSRGPRRSAETTQRILAATTDLLVEGPHAATMRAIASRAGVTLPMIYRRWESREALVVEVVERLLDAESAIPDSGSLRKDLLELQHQSSQMLSGPGGALMRTVVAMAVDDQLLHAALDALTKKRRAESLVMLERAVQRGEMRKGLDLVIVGEMIAGPYIARLLLTGEPMDDATAAAVTDLALAAVSPSAEEKEKGA